MKILTTEQQEIVDKLINEFTKLNDKPKGGEFSLLNYNALNVERDRQLNGERATKAHNDSINALRAEVCKDIAKMLEDDIRKGNLPLKVVSDGGGVTIGSKNGFTNNDVYLYVMATTISTEFGNRAEQIYFSATGNCNDMHYKTAEEVINLENFQKSLMILIKKGV